MRFLDRKGREICDVCEVEELRRVVQLRYPGDAVEHGGAERVDHGAIAAMGISTARGTCRRGRMASAPLRATW